MDLLYKESEEFRRQADEAKKHSEHVRREIQRMRIANADLSQQVSTAVKVLQIQPIVFVEQSGIGGGGSTTSVFPSPSGFSPFLSTLSL